MGGVCKMDMQVDKGKTRLLYLPGWAGGLLVFSEISFWTLHIDPLLSTLLGVVPVYFFAQFFTQKIFAQQPLVVTSPCPKCSALITVYFDDTLIKWEGKERSLFAKLNKKYKKQVNVAK